MLNTREKNVTNIQQTVQISNLTLYYIILLIFNYYKRIQINF